MTYEPIPRDQLLALRNSTFAAMPREALVTTIRHLVGHMLDADMCARCHIREHELECAFCGPCLDALMHGDEQFRADTNSS